MSDRAMSALEEARELLEESPTRSIRRLPAAGALPASLRAERDFIEAEAWRNRGYFGKSEKLYKSVLKKTQPGEDPALWIEAAIGSASGNRSIGCHREAALLLKKAERVARKSRIHRAFADRFALESALADRAAERYGPSLTYFRTRLRSARARQDWQEAAFLLWAIGGAQRFQGKLQEAQASFTESLRFARRAKDAIGAGYALFGLGGATRVRGQLEKSERHYAKAGSMFAKTEDDFAKAYAFCGRANALRQLGRLNEAEKSYRHSRVIYAKLGDPIDLAYVDWGLGEIALKRGRTREALSPLKKAEKGFTEGGETRGEVLVWISTARAYHALGRTRESEVLFSKAVALARKNRIHTHLESYT